jgi:DNA-binding transcriptional ArsR family regulator
MVKHAVLSVGELDRVFLALGDASRRHILAQLAQRGSLSVGEASQGLALSPAGITKHVRVLEDAGLVARRLAGRRHVLSLEADRLLLAENWIDRYRTLWRQSLGRLAALAQAIDEEEQAIDEEEQAIDEEEQVIDEGETT